MIGEGLVRSMRIIFGGFKPFLLAVVVDCFPNAVANFVKNRVKHIPVGFMLINRKKDSESILGVDRAGCVLSDPVLIVLIVVFVDFFVSVGYDVEGKNIAESVGYE